jgi:hypothetical protein
MAAEKKIDPLNLTSRELTQILNSTQIGSVTSKQNLENHKDKAGFRIGAGKTFNLPKYFAWLLTTRHDKPDGKSYEQHKADQALKQKIASQAARDIGDIPEIKNPERREKCRESFQAFCENYFPQMFYMGWSPDHLRVIGKIENAVLRGGLFAFAMPRGSGKTSMSECAAVWSVLYGHRKFVVVIGPSSDHAEQLLDAIKMHLETNPFLAEDFPAAIYPIQKLEGISKRCLGQVYNGNRTHIEWADEIVLATIPGSPSSGAIIKTAGLTGAGVRGAKYQTADGKTMRPEMVIVDDPQTDESARSRDQCRTREKIISGAVLGMAGHKRKIAGFMPCTVIRPGDVTDTILNKNIHPVWNGERTKLVYEFPTNMKLWEKYAEIRADSLRADRDIADATAFYLANKSEMDAGAKVAWDERFDDNEISALQFAMNIKFNDEETFFAEYQNEPMQDKSLLDGTVSAVEIAEKTNGYKPGEVPLSVNYITMFIDIQQRLLFYTIVGWSEDFTGYVLDYGTYPDQKRNYFTLADAQNNLDVEFPTHGMEGKIYAGLEKLTGQMLPLEWRRTDGTKMKISQCMIDANWGPSTDMIYKFCKQSEFSSVLIPSHGKYVGASSKPFGDYTKKPGERTGINWRIPIKDKREVRHVVFDTNYWKSFIFSRFATALGDRANLSIFGDKRINHQCFADHLTAEYRIRTTGRGRVVDEWKLRPGGGDNHWLDCVVGCAVGAAIQGATLAEIGSGATTKKKKVAVDMNSIRQSIASGF